jgi:hypothetical protein
MTMTTYPETTPTGRRHHLAHDAAKLGLMVATWSPGDGMTRYRFFPIGTETDAQDFFGPRNGLYTALGLKEAFTWLNGYRDGKAAGLDEARQLTAEGESC